ncbi:hypothetical protein TIFTF001_018211 [Ficus carica]|uniref:Uncharacterized protein n=1 Tax=Ficus carica TaxID=3494 RepID=A0AA88ARR0_FICCA|nr:hypothetical protein TIFTF001_018211 [Ficus carica]
MVNPPTIKPPPNQLAPHPPSTQSTVNPFPLAKSPNGKIPYPLSPEPPSDVAPSPSRNRQTAKSPTLPSSSPHRSSPFPPRRSSTGDPPTCNL